MDPTEDRLILAGPSTINQGESMSIDPNAVRVFYQPEGMARLTVTDDRSYLKIRVARAAPLSRPDSYVSLLNGKGEEIVMLPRLEVLDLSSRRVVERELERRYL